MRNHEQERSILDQQGEVTPWMGEVQIFNDHESPSFSDTKSNGSPYYKISVEQETQMSSDLQDYEEGDWADKARKANQDYMQTLGWGKYLDQIYVLLTGAASDLLSSALAKSLPVHSREFAYRVSDWQDGYNKKPGNNNRPKLKVNGALDLDTSKAMQAALNIVAPVPSANVKALVNPAAIALNKEWSVKLGWGKYLDRILILLTGKKESGILASPKMPAQFLDIGSQEFAYRVYDWQSKHVKGKPDGCLGLDTWSVMQEYMGFFKLSTRAKIKNIESVKKANRKYKNEYSRILRGLALEEVIKSDDLQFNEEYLAYCIAQYQIKMSERAAKGIKIAVNGVIDTKTYTVLIGLGGDLEKIVTNKINLEDLPENTSELAQEFIFTKTVFEKFVCDEFIDLKGHLQKLQVKPEKSFWSNAVDVGMFLLNSTMKVVGSLYTGGEAAVDIADKITDGSPADLTLPGMILSPIGDALINDAKKTAEIRQQKIEATIKNVTENLGYVAYKNQVIRAFNAQKVLGRLDDVRQIIAEIQTLTQDEKSAKKIIRKFLLLDIFNLLKVHPRLIIGFSNQTPIENWTLTDIDNVKKKWGELRIEFCQDYTNLAPVNGIPQIPVRLPSDVTMISKALWAYWHKSYELHEFDLRLSKIEFLKPLWQKKAQGHNIPGHMAVYFKANHSEGVTFVSPHLDKSSINGTPLMKAPFELHVMNIKMGSLRWNTEAKFTYTNEMIFINNKNTFIKRKNTDKNLAGVEYDKIVKDIVSHVLGNKYNGSGFKAEARKVIFWEGETHSHAPYEIDTEQEYDNFEPLEGEVVMPHPNRSRFRPLSQTFMSPQVLQSNSTANQRLLAKAQLGIGTISGRLDVCVRMEEIEHFMKEHNRQYPDNAYVLSSADQSSTGAVFTEAIHQFQIINYFDTKEHTGLLDASLLDTLRFAEHGLRPRLSSSGFFGQKKLNEISRAIAAVTNYEFSAANWFKYIMRPSFLGHKIKDGVHLLLLLKLGHAETWLLSQPQYKGMTPVQLGRALGLGQPDVVYSGARLSNENQAMHGFGLAIDIDKAGNPWIGAGWIQNDKEKLKERTQMLQTLRKASTETLKGGNIFQYLDSIARDVGNDTRQAYQVLEQRNQEFIAYLQNNRDELQYWKNSATFTKRDPLKGFLSLHSDLVYALREVAGLAWGAIDFGPRASGDIMHFDLRTQGAGKVICKHLSGYIPKYGHPVLSGASAEKEWEYEDYEDVDTDDMADPEMEWEHHEAIEEAEWEEEEDEENHDHEF